MSSLTESPVVLDNYLSVITGYNLTATTALLLWDILLTLPKEIVYIWFYDQKANLTTLFYIITRYIPFAVSAIFLWLRRIKEYTPSGDPTFPQDLNIFNNLHKFLWFVVLACTEILFIKRTVALYEGSKLLYRILIGLFICEMVAGIVSFIFLALEAIDLGATLIKVQTGYSVGYEVTVPFPVIAFALPELAFQALLVVLIINRVRLKYWRSQVAGSNLVSIVIRDGLWSYLCNLCGFLILVIHPTWLSVPMGQPNLLWSYVTFSITSSRLILNIRGAATARQSEVTSSTTRFRLTFLQDVQSFLTSGMDEISRPVHYSDLEHDEQRYYSSNRDTLLS